MVVDTNVLIDEIDFILELKDYSIPGRTVLESKVTVCTLSLEIKHYKSSI